MRKLLLALMVLCAILIAPPTTIMTMMLASWKPSGFATVNMVVVALGSVWLGLRLVSLSLVNAKPPWANRSLLNYVRNYAARYSPLRIAQQLTEHVIDGCYVSNRVKANVSEAIEPNRWHLATLAL